MSIFGSFKNANKVLNDSKKELDRNRKSDEVARRREQNRSKGQSK